MNYLAHLFLAAPDNEFRIGSLLADFTNGILKDLEKRFSERIALGIKHHREIDRYTDEHPAIHHSIELLEDDYGLYSGIIVDVVQDHFLLKHWSRFSTQSKDEFFDSIYRSLDCWDFNYPERYQVTVRRMIQLRWLDMYLDLEKVAFALSRIGERFERETPLGRTLPGLQKNYQELEADFLTFFPQLMQFSQKLLSQ